MSKSKVERAVSRVGVRRALLGSAASVIVVVSCGGNVSDEPTDPLSNPTARGGGGAPSAMPRPPKPRPPDSSNKGGGGFGETFPGFAGGCTELFTSSGTGPICHEPPSCRDFTSTETCAAAGCIVTTGDVSLFLGYGGDENHARCELTPDVFISCEAGYGGDTSNTGCNKACDACIEGGWTVSRSGDWPRTDCFWSCVNGLPMGTAGGYPDGP